METRQGTRSKRATPATWPRWPATIRVHQSWIGCWMPNRMNEGASPKLVDGNSDSSALLSPLNPSFPASIPAYSVANENGSHSHPSVTQPNSPIRTEISHVDHRLSGFLKLYLMQLPACHQRMANLANLATWQEKSNADEQVNYNFHHDGVLFL